MVSICSFDAHKPVPPQLAQPTLPTASCVPNASATKFANGPCSIWDAISRSVETTGQCCASALRKFSAARCAGCPLLTLGRVLDASGFVRRSQVFAGNVHESHTLAGMLDALNAPRGALVVMDRGIATEDRIQWLRERGYRYLVVSRARTRHFDAAAGRIETALSHGVQLHKEWSDDAREVRLYCFSEKRVDKERSIVERFAKRFEDALTQFSEGLAKPRTQKRVDHIWQRIGGSGKTAAASLSTMTSNLTLMKRDNAPRPCASPAARSPTR